MQLREKSDMFYLVNFLFVSTFFVHNFLYVLKKALYSQNDKGVEDRRKIKVR